MRCIRALSVLSGITHIAINNSSETGKPYSLAAVNSTARLIGVRYQRTVAAIDVDGYWNAAMSAMTMFIRSTAKNADGTTSVSH